MTDGKDKALSVRSGRRGRIHQPVVSCSPQDLLTRQQKNSGRSQARGAWLQPLFLQLTRLDLRAPCALEAACCAASEGSLHLRSTAIRRRR